MKRSTALLALTLGTAPLLAADAPATSTTKSKAPAPFVYDGNPERRKYELPVEPDENVADGPHRMQVIYFWRAKRLSP